MRILLVYSIFLSTGLFAWGPLEEMFSFVNILQFPWRLLIFGAIPYAVLVGLATFEKKQVYISVVFLTWLCFTVLCCKIGK